MANGERPVVHFRGNSEEALEQLFGVLKKDQQTRGLKERNLPPSFFIQPQKPSFNGGLQSHPTHVRSQSSPALSSQPLAVPQHGRQQSADLLGDTWNPSESRPPTSFHQFGYERNHY